MKKSVRFIATVLVLGAYLLSACTGGAAPQSNSSANPQDNSGSNDVVFTGAVESISGDQWTVNGQTIKVDGSTAVDANINVGDVVKVEASVDQNGTVMAVKIESSTAGVDDNSNSANGNDSNANDNTNDDNVNTNDNTNTGGNSNDSTTNEQEVSGVVGAISDTSVSIDGVEYGITGDTQINDVIVTGDQVKAQILINTDGTMVVSEIEKVDSVGTDDNSNGNANDDQVGNSNGNSNDDDQVDNSNDNSSNDNSQVDNSNDQGDNSNDQSNDSGGNSNDDNGGGGSNDNGGNSNGNDG